MATFTSNGEPITSASPQYDLPIVCNNGAIKVDSQGNIYTDGTQEVVTDSLGNTASAERLLAVGDYKDTQSVINGSVTRRVGIKVLDGTENWDTDTLTNCYSLQNVVGAGTFTNRTVYCTHFKNSATLPEAGQREGYALIGNKSKSYTIGFGATTQFTTVTDWNNWLAQQYANGTPVIVVYPLATATTSTVTGQFLSKSPVTQTAGSISNLPIAITESSHTVPTPEQPLQINCNNGVVKVSPNLFDKNNTLEDGRIWRNVGLQGNLSGYYGVNPIKVKGGHTYTRKGSHGGANYFLLNDDTSLSVTDNSDTITVPDNAVMWYFNNAVSTDRNTMMIVEGDTLPATYMPYGTIYVDGTVETVEITGKNLFDKNAITQGYIYNAQLEYVTSDIASLSDYIPVVAGQPYTFTGYKEITGNFNIRINYFDTDKEIQSQVVKAVGLGNYSFTITIPSGIKYLRYSFRTEMTDSQQLELGSTATDYEPYYNGGTATAENLFKVGTYQDVQSVIDGGVSRSVGVKVLDGTEDWIKSTAAGVGSLFYCTQTNMNDEATSPALCTHYIGELPNVSGKGQSDKSTKAGYDGASAAYNRMYLKDSSFSTVIELTTFLADQYAQGTPVIIVYPLATATTETVTGQPMNIQAGTNIVQITQASMDGLELEVKYKAGVAVTITEIENAQLDDNVEVTING